MKDQENQDASQQDQAMQSISPTPPSSTQPSTPSSKPLRASKETLAKIDPRLRKIYEHYGTWARVARKFCYTERGIASWARKGIPACREGKVDEVVREIEGKKKK